MEQLLHYVWKHKLFPLQHLHTPEGESIEVIDPGLPNPHAGADFFNAKIKIQGVCRMCDSPFWKLAERVGFEPTVRCRITSFQD